VEQRNRNRFAFTLVELLVVIGIIAILIAILLPAISRAKDQANTTACLANMRSLGQLMVAYQVEYKGAYPYSLFLRNVVGGGPSSVGDGGSSNTDKGVFVWWSVIRKYMKNGKFANHDNFVDFASDRFMAAFNCPTGIRRDAGCDFASNQLIMPGWPYERSSVAPTNPKQALLQPGKTGQVKADNVVLWDATEIPPNYNTQYVMGFNVDRGNHGVSIAGGALSTQSIQFRYFRGQAPAGAGNEEISDDGIVPQGPNTDAGAPGSEGNIRWRHRRGVAANFLMGDGSVRTMTIPKRSDRNDLNSPPISGELIRRLLRPSAPSGFTPAS